MRKPRRVKEGVIQYVVLGLILLPILIPIAIWVAPLVNNGFLMVLIYSVIILAGWFVWVIIRQKLYQRAERIRKQRELQRKKIEKVAKMMKKEELKEETKNPEEA